MRVDDWLPEGGVAVIAELSGNHNGDLGRALALVDAAAEAGADAIKLQTYTADAMTLDSDRPEFRIGEGTAWSGRRLHELYREAATPWAWHEPLFARAHQAGLAALSTPFDLESLAFLETLDPPAHKVASFELVDLELIAAVAATGRPMVLSTGMASIEEIDQAVTTARDHGAEDLVLLRCNSAYPAPAGEMDLRTLPDMKRRWGVRVGLSDHSLGSAPAVVAVTLGAEVVEKHLTLRRADGGPDAGFSLEPHELTDQVAALREAAASLGAVRYGPSPAERPSLAFRRSLFVVADIAEGETITRDNVRAIRPSHGLPPSEMGAVLGRRATTAIETGTPLSWELMS